jgi:Cupin superfamily protein
LKGNLTGIKAVNILDLTWDTFYNAHFVSETPILIKGVGVDHGTEGKWNAKTLLEALVSSPTAVPKASGKWYDDSRSFLENDYREPALVTQVLSSPFCCVRQTCRRFWVHPKGNITKWHYDGNSLFVFNLQVQGKKAWTIVSPETPLLCYPFDRVAVPFAYHRPRPDTIFSDFVTEEGDMLFLPPYWMHRVEALGDTNININWVATNRNPSLASKILLREQQLMKLLKLSKELKIDRFLGDDWPSNELLDYAGEGYDFVERFTQDISVASALRFALTEISRLRTLRMVGKAAEGYSSGRGETGRLFPTA